LFNFSVGLFFFFAGHLLEGWSFELEGERKHYKSLMDDEKHFLHSQFPLEHPPPLFLAEPKKCF
jgi:hypothetical protein